MLNLELIYYGLFDHMAAKLLNDFFGNPIGRLEKIIEQYLNTIILT